MTGTASVWVAFLRGINVGGKRKLPMAALADAFAALGAADVRTYIQSGNVAFQASEEVARALPERFAQLSAERFGFAVPAAVRSRQELREVANGNPFADDNADEKALHVVFLTDLPAAAAVARLDPERSPPDAFTVRGRDIYLRLPNGMARTKLTNAYFDAVLGTTSTARNWRTVQAMVALAGG